MINISRRLVIQAAVGPKVIVSHPEQFQVIIAELNFIINSLEQPFHLPICSGAMHPSPDMLYASSPAPSVKPAVLAIQTVSASVIS